MMDVHHGNNPLAKLDAATRMLAEARTLDEIKNIKDTAVAAQAYAKARGLGEEAERYASEIRLEASRRMGQVLIEAKDAGEFGQGVYKKSQLGTFCIDEIGITKNESSAAQTLASVPEEEWETVKTEAVSEGVRTERKRAEAIKRPHVSNNSGNNEWYTPPEYIAAARAVMGTIDLDPASTLDANQVVRADKFFTSDDDGLAQEWAGNVWMNPPYASNLVARFADKLAESVADGDVSQAIVLVNNATETAWFRTLVEISMSVCFPASRIKFWQPSGEFGAPLQGQAILYCGENYESFARNFYQYGWVAAIGSR